MQLNSLIVFLLLACDIARKKKKSYSIFFCLKGIQSNFTLSFLTMHREILKVLSRKHLPHISNSNGNSFHFWSCRKAQASDEAQYLLCVGLGCMTVTEYVWAVELRDQKRLSNHMFKRTGSKNGLSQLQPSFQNHLVGRILLLSRYFYLTVSQLSS